MQDCSVLKLNLSDFNLEWYKLKLGGMVGAAQYKVWEVTYISLSIEMMLNSGNNVFLCHYSLGFPSMILEGGVI